MDGLTTHAPMTHLLRERGVFDRYPFVLIDVGCAGGIDDAWRAFGPSLVAHAYDPDISACEDAQAREPFEHVSYHARHVGLPESHPFVQRKRDDAAGRPNTNIWGRISAGYLAQRAQTAPSPVSSPPPTGDPNDVIGVDGIVRGAGLATVDFLKVDVDGPDVEVLESAREVFATSRVLGVGMEVNWFGTESPTEHTFHNTDRFLREQGFTLFGLTTRRYSRTDLPAPFEREAYAFTHFGQPYQGDAIYLRDLAADHLSDLAADYPPDKLIKLACVYELAGLPDCAAEMLNRFERRLAEFGDRAPLLDALTPPLLGERLSYREYIARFKRSPELFLPSAAPQVREPGAPVAAPNTAAAPAVNHAAARGVPTRIRERIRGSVAVIRSVRGRR
jgi:Methyltransferase FkbM domain